MKAQVSTRFFAKLAVRRLFRVRRTLPLTALMAGALCAPHAGRAADVSHTIIAGATGNVSDSTQYSAANPPDATTAGDILQDTAVAAPGSFTLTVDVPVTIGTIKLNSNGAHSGTFAAGAGVFTLDNTGGTVTNIFGNTDASIGQNANAGVLTVGANVVAANSTLDIGSTQSGTVTVTGNITASTATTLNLRQNATQTSTTITDLISGNIGATGSAIAINNVSSGASNKDIFSLTGAIGGAATTGAAVTITNASTGSAAFNISGALGASLSSITQNGVGTMTISSANAGYAGATSIQAGTLSINSATALSLSPVTLSNVAGATLNVAGASTIGSLSGGGTTGGNVSLSATLTTGGLNASPTYAGAISGTGGLTKVGTGTLTLAGTNTYSGTTAVNNGTLKLDFTAATAPTTGGILGNTTAAPLSLGGGTLNIVGAAGGSTQTFSATAIAAGGGSVISAAPTTGGTNPIVNLGTLTGSQGGLVRFDGAAYNNGASSGTTIGGNTVAATATFNATTITGTGGLISTNTASPAGPYATVGLYDWAAISAGTSGAATSGTIVGLSQISGGYTVVNGNLPASSFGGNFDMTANGAMNAGGTGGTGAAYNTVRFNTNAAITLNTGKVTAASVGGLLVTPNVGANNTTLSNGSNGGFFASRASGATTGLTVWQNNTLGEFILTATLNNGTNSGATTSYTQGGPGTVLLSGVNGYTGQNYLDGGATVIAAYSGLGGGSAPTTLAAVNLGGGTLFGNAATVSTDFSSTVLRGVVVNAAGGTLAAATGDTLTVGGAVSGSGNLSIGTGTLAGTGAGTANTTALVGNGTVVLTGANSYTGGTTLNAGTLNINGLFALGGANYAGTTFNGGTLQLAAGTGGAFSTTFGGGDISNFGGVKPVTINAGGATVDTNGNTVTFASTIGNNGTGALTVKSTAAGGILTLSAPSTYTGGTTVSTGALTLTATGTLGSGNVTVGAGAALTLGSTNNAIGDAATLTFGAGSSIVGNVAGTENLGAITNGTLTLNAADATQSTYSAADLNTFFGGSSFSGVETYAFTAVPEPSTYVGGAFLLVTAAGWSLRRRAAAGNSAAAV